MAFLIFLLANYLILGYYADQEMRCQGYHVCLTPERSPTDRKTSFLCPNGTIFSQKLFTCDWWFVQTFIIIYYIKFII